MNKQSNTGWLLLAGLAAVSIAAAQLAKHQTSATSSPPAKGDTVKIIGGEITFN